ncbi:MAG: NUDIX domain-containing protein [bacterium]|nr:NUDIX domain-containing protein [bacterium]
MRKVISAGIIIFRKTDKGPKFLLLYHGHHYWNFPKGKMESGERSWQSALREVNEETGLKNTELRFIRNFKAHERFTMGRGATQLFKVVILYLAETKQPNITVSHEHEGYAWFTFSEAKRVLGRYAENIKILTTANDFVSKSVSKIHPPQSKSRTSPSVKQKTTS